MRKIALDKAELLYEALAKNYALYMPVDTDAGAEYKKWEKGTKLSNALNTVRSAKDFFFPQTENLMDFKMEGKTIEIIDTREESEDFIIFGVRACDVKSFEVLDGAFLEGYVDTFYKNRRDHAVIFSMACNKPAQTCFCQTFDIDASKPDGDVRLYKDEEYLYLDAVTEKGEKLLASLDVLACGGEKEAEAVAATIKARLEKLPLASLKKDAFGDGKTSEFFDAPEWKSLSEACIGCGTCTFVCPTCQCYDIKDINTGHGVKRFRCWDSCMYSEFTKMSAGQPRLTQLERFRQRFMHKLVYYPTAHNGLFSCVGCGRCLSRCPIQMNIVKVMKELGGKKNG